MKKARPIIIPTADDSRKTFSHFRVAQKSNFIESRADIARAFAAMIFFCCRKIQINPA